MLRASFEGDFASCNPRAQVLTGPGALVAGNPEGVSVGRFAWADIDTGQANNARTNSQQILGFVLPLCGGWQRVYVARGQSWIRPGLAITLCSRGDFWARFASGAQVGNPVYADILDGSVISGYSAGAELTPWTVLSSCLPGQLAIISTWSKFYQ